MQSVDLKGIERLDNDFEYLLREIPEARREMHDRIGKAVLGEVRDQISKSEINDSNDRVKNVQEHYVGSYGGYAAVRAIRGSGPSGHNDSPGAITNYLENGHRIREPLGKSKSYRPRIRKTYVDGYHFYQRARNNAESIAIAAAEKYAEEVADRLEG